MKTAARISGHHLRSQQAATTYCVLALGILVLCTVVVLCIVPPEFNVTEHVPNDPAAQSRHTGQLIPVLKRSKVVNSVAIREANMERFEKRQAKAKQPRPLSDSVSIIAACRDHTGVLETTLSSWRRVKGVSEIVLVDYGSIHESGVATQMNRFMGSNNGIGEVLVRMTDTETPWSLSRAYNLAASIAFGRVIVKVDCDTVLAPNFLKYHPLDLAHRHMFYTSNWSTSLGNPLSGVFVMDKSLFEMSAGYDERIVSRGGEDVELYERLLHKRGMYFRELNKKACHHISHENQRSIVRRPVPTTSSGRENILALAAIGKIWKLSTRREIGTSFELSDETPRTYRSSNVAVRPSGLVVIRAIPVRWSPDALGLLSDDELNRIQSLAATEALSKDFHFPIQVAGQISPLDATQLLSQMQNAPDAAVIFLELSGPSISDRIMGLIRAIGWGHSIRRPLVVYWLPLSANVLQSEKHVTLSTLLDLQATNDALESARMETKIFDGGLQWPCPSSYSRTCANRDHQFRRIADMDQLDLSISRNRHIHTRLGPCISESDILPIRPSNAYRRPSDTIRFDAALAAALKALVLPIDISSNMAHFAESSRQTIGIFHSKPWSGLSDTISESQGIPHQARTLANDLHRLQLLGSNSKREVRIASDGPDSVLASVKIATALGMPENIVRGSGCKSAGSMDRETSCAKNSFANILTAVHSRFVLPNVDKDGMLVSQPGARALRAMRAIMRPTFTG